METNMAETLRADARAVVKDMEAALQDDGGITVKTLGWVMLASLKVQERMAVTLDALCVPPARPRWQELLTEQLIKSLSLAVVGLIGYIILNAIQSGWRP